MNNPSKKSFFLEPVTENEVLKVVNSSPNKTSMDHSGINFALVKECISVIAIPISHIANISFEMGIFPDQMKIAKVIPIFKSGLKDSFTNYRPVSLLPQFSKILEKLFNNRLNKFLEINNTLSNSEYGFRNNSTTSHALIDLHEQLTKSIDNKLSTIGVFIDLKKAFDTIDHTLLLQKLNRYGIRGIANAWLASYLKERSQYVFYNNENSDPMNMWCGVPQGSILGPKLLILYINDMVNVSNISKFIIFADDTNLFCTSKEIVSLSVTICQQIVSKLHKNYYVIKRASRLLSTSSLTMLYNSLCLPSMLYCCEIWGRASGYLLNKITLLQKKFIRMVHTTCYLEHTKPLFELSFIFTFPDLLEYAMAILMFKAFHNLLPINIQNIFQIHINIRSSRRKKCFP